MDPSSSPFFIISINGEHSLLRGKVYGSSVAFGDGPWADLIAYGLGAALSRPGRPKPCWDCHFGE